jgi:phosphoribosyl 1,2-cyclic phosphate phosphodiesterase
MLGCGGSQGVPTAAGEWGACDPANPLNRRLRVSVLIETADASGDTRRFVIDTSPDFREQMIRAGVDALDGVLFTHAHADHLHGIDDLRSFNRRQKRKIPIYAAPATMAEVRQRFGYVLAEPAPGVASFYKPMLEPHEIAGPFLAAEGVEILPFEQDHGFTTTLGFRIGDFAYSTDFVRLDETALTVLQGVDTWIVDCVRIAPAHPTHCHLEQTLHWLDRVRPRRAILTHMDPSCDYAALKTLLPQNAEPGFDGLVIEL